MYFKTRTFQPKKEIRAFFSGPSKTRVILFDGFDSKSKLDSAIDNVFDSSEYPDIDRNAHTVVVVHPYDD